MYFIMSNLWTFSEQNLRILRNKMEKDYAYIVQAVLSEMPYDN